MLVESKREQGMDGGLEKHSEDRKKVVIYALSMALGTFSSRVLGLVRDMAFAALFSRTITDAWTAAFRLPNLFRRLLGEGSLSVSFIPVFVEAHLDSSKESGKNSKNEQLGHASERARNLVNGFYTLLLLVLTVLTTAGILGAEGVLKLILDPAYVSDPARFEVTVRMAKIMFGFIFLMSQYAFFMGILNALGHYAWAAMAPVFFNIAMIVSTLMPQDWFPYAGDGLAWGVLAGGFLQMIVLIPQLQKKGYLPRLSRDLFNKDVLHVLRNMAPGLLGTGLLQIATIVNLRFASQLGEGPISYIYWADRLLELPLSLVAVSLGTALLPTLAKMWSQGSPEKMLGTSNYYLRLNLFVALPAAVGLMTLAEPIVEVLFKRGRFLDADVAATAMVVRIYGVILISASSVRVLVPVFYAIKNTWWPTVVSATALVAHIIAAPWMMDKWGLKGLVASSFFSQSVNLGMLAFAVPYFIGPYGWAKLFMSSFKFSISALAMGVVVTALHPVLRQFFGSGEIGRIVALAITIGVGGLVYAAGNALFKSEELIVTWSTLRDKLLRKFKRR